MGVSGNVPVGHRETRTEFLLKVDPPIRQFKMVLSAGPVATTATVKICGRTHEIALEAKASKDLVIDLCDGFPYRFDLEPEHPSHLMWPISVASSNGFSPAAFQRPDDLRFLGVRVTPSIVR